MSGIAGRVGERGQNEPSRIVEAMLAAMAQRGPDGSAVWAGKGAALGHALLQTEPQAASEAQPLTEGVLTIVADARLDNRAELIEALAARDATLSDARLILHAYRRWGADCAARLLGDFAFAIWDEADATLFAARDFGGTKPFYYHDGETQFVFASEPKAVVAAPGVPKVVDELRIAEYLGGFWPPVDKTPYASVLRLEPGHSLTVRDGQVSRVQFWSIPTNRAVARKDAPEAFLEIFTRAVSDRMRGMPNVGAMLSGGMDSSSISAVAAPIYRRQTGKSLPTFSMVFDATPKWSERPFIEAVLGCGDYDPSFMTCDDTSPLDDIDGIFREQGEYHLAPALDLTSHVYDQAAASGVKVLLSGHGGDEVVSHGWGRLHELAAAGAWPRLWRESQAAGSMYGTSGPRVFWDYFTAHGPLRPVRNKWTRGQAKLARLAGRTQPSGPPAWHATINPDLVARTGVMEAWREAMRPSATARTQHDQHRAYVAPRAQSYGLEVLDRAAAGAGIEVRYPFWDQRLLEFCLSLEPDEILDGGWPRLVLRRAMEGLLPKKVQWRRDKLDFTGHQVLAMVGRDRDELDAVLLRDRDDIGGYVNLDVAAAAWKRILDKREGAYGGDVQTVWRAAIFANWLRRARAEGVSIA